MDKDKVNNLIEQLGDFNFFLYAVSKAQLKFKIQPEILTTFYEIKNEIINSGSGEQCRWKIDPQYFKLSLDRADLIWGIKFPNDFMLSFYQHFYHCAYLFVELIDENSANLLLLCSQSFILDNNKFNLPFGLLLQNQAYNYLYNHDIKYVNLITTSDLISYYQQLGYRINGNEDKQITMQLELTFDYLTQFNRDILELLQGIIEKLRTLTSQQLFQLYEIA